MEWGHPSHCGQQCGGGLGVSREPPDQGEGMGARWIFTNIKLVLLGEP